MFYAYKHPTSVQTENEWIAWVFRLRRKNKRHALEFVEGWNSKRVVIAALFPWMVSCLVGIIWSLRGGDAQTAFTVAGFILTSGTGKTSYVFMFNVFFADLALLIVVLALLAFISNIESSGRSS